MSEKTVLQMKNINKSFSGVQVLHDVHFDLKRGEVHALLGENGAGKSTLIKILAGIHQPDSGEIRIDGEKVEIQKVTDSQKYGVSVIHQELSLASNMTIADNVYMGRLPGKHLVDDKALNKNVQEMLDSFGLDLDPQCKAGSLSVAQQQMVEIVRALSVDARILVMDEPTASLTDKEIDKLFEFITTLQSHGVAIIYISHRMEEIFKIASRVTVLRDGYFIGTKAIHETDYEDIVSMMVGREFKDVYPQTSGEIGEIIMQVKNLNAGSQVQDINFDLKKGEVLGFYGLMGSGRTEIMRAIFGIDPKTTGNIYLEGKEITIHSPIDAISAGIALAPENRKEEGLVLIQGIDFNICLPILKQIIKGIRLNRSKQDEILKTYGKKLDIRASSFLQKVMNLSGGNQQKVVLAKWLATNPKILILDEPTRGIDVGAKQEIYKLVCELADSGIGVIFISSELPEIVNICNRVLIMREGKMTGVIQGEEISEKNIMKFAVGGVANVK